MAKIQKSPKFWIKGRISLYQKDCVYLCKQIKTYSYRKNQSYTTTEQQRLQLEKGFRKSKSHAYRMHCRAVLLKSTGLTSEQVSLQTEMTNITVNSWVKRFETEGIRGLETRPDRGRKPIMDCSDEEAVRKAIENNRQSMKKAKED